MATNLISNNAEEQQPERGVINFREFLGLCLSNWKWFLLSVVLCLGIAFLYIKSTQPTFQQSAQILIKTDDKGRAMSQNMSMFSDLGLTMGNNGILDEVAILKSPDIMADVVRMLDINYVYTVKGYFRDGEIYGQTLPINVSLPDLPDRRTVNFDLTLDDDSHYTIENIEIGTHEYPDRVIKGEIGIPVWSPMGRVIVTPSIFAKNDKYDDEEQDDKMKHIHVSRTPVRKMAKSLMHNIGIEVDEEAENVVTITYNYPVIEKAADIINALIVAYNDSWMHDKQIQADNSSRFIDERIGVLQQELGTVDRDISSYKSSNMIPDIATAASMYMEEASKSDIALKELRNQDYMAKYLGNYLRNGDNSKRMLPVNTLPTNPSLATQVTEYNKMMLERNSLAAQSSEANPLVQKQDESLATMRQALLASIDNEIVNLQAQIRSQEGMSGRVASRIASNPQQARYLLSVERQQKVKETLYLYLLQKREENQLNQAMTANNTRVIRQADGPERPIRPNKFNLVFLAFAAGILIPGCVLYLRELSVNFVRGRKDIENMKTPFAGELPYAGKKRKSFRYAGKHKEGNIVVVEANNRNVINEAFRVIRTNVEFMNGNDKNGHHVIMLTSANPGSGKTFVTYNLGKSFALKNKKVV